MGAESFKNGESPAASTSGTGRRGTMVERLKQTLKSRLSPSQRRLLRRLLADFTASFRRRDLNKLAQLYRSDKWGTHWYTQHYQRHFAHMRNRKVVLIEIGIGGYSDPESGGSSLRMWRKYFPQGRIYGIDIADKSPHNERRIRTFKGDQSDEIFLRHVISQTGTPDIIIDDGSHLNHHVIKTFDILFPLLADQGIYAVEDTQTSYWPDYGGSSRELDSAQTSMRKLKGLADGLNHAEYIRPGFEPSYFDKHIVAMHFYHNLVFVCKGWNNEGSNEIKGNMPPSRPPET
jgi:hypothetical protein